ncbi:hypothetical protein [Falsibacillus pallidus]|uniref:hypothetical protein n=1 Tax=Falsibacillus pallidus TaxID=493781 RepID=UPI003D99ADFA
MENNLVDFEIIEKLEDKYLGITTINNGPEENRLLNIEKIIKSLKQKLIEVSTDYSELLKVIANDETDLSFDIEITEGMIKQSYLTLKPLNNSSVAYSLLPSEDTEDIKIIFPEPIGEVTTAYSKRYNRLKVRGVIRFFYEEFGLMPYSILTFTKLTQKKYKIGIKSKF